MGDLLDTQPGSMGDLAWKIPADALRLAADFAGGQRICVILGDNIIQRSLRPHAERFVRQREGARIILKKTVHPERFGVPRFDRSRLVEIVEKPKIPPSQYAVIGVYFYDAGVFDIISTLRPSKRGELEITDVTNRYLERGSLTHGILPGWWTDAGTYASLHRAAQLAAKTWFLPGARSAFWGPFDRWVEALSSGGGSLGDGAQSSRRR